MGYSGRLWGGKYLGTVTDTDLSRPEFPLLISLAFCSHQNVLNSPAFWSHRLISPLLVSPSTSLTPGGQAGGWAGLRAGEAEGHHRGARANLCWDVRLLSNPKVAPFPKSSFVHRDVDWNWNHPQESHMSLILPKSSHVASLCIYLSVSRHFPPQ